MKSGIKTSEFWVALIPTVVSMLVLTGVISTADESQLVSLGRDIVSGVVAIVSIVSYIQNRRDIKITEMRTNVRG